MIPLNLLLVRDILSANETHGRLYVNGTFECFTLEDTDLYLERNPEAKIKGATAIPTGIYKVGVNLSRRFGRLMPIIENVPGFSGIRIHSGNTAVDTEGCILVGKTRWKTSIGDSKEAYNYLFTRIKTDFDAKRDISLRIIRS